MIDSVRLFGALALAWATTLSLAHAADGPRYVLEDLGVYSFANALGPKGWPVGSHGNLAAYQADGEWVQLKTKSKYDSSTAHGANRFGHVVGHESAQHGYRPVHWTPDGRRHAIELPGDGDEVGWALGVSRHGLVAGKYSTSQDDWTTDECCFIARPGEAAFDPMPGAAFCQVGGVNAHGLVAIGGVTDQGFIWHEGQVTVSFGPLPGYTWTQPQSINDAGQVVGWTSAENRRQVGFVWDGHRLWDLGTLEGGSSAYLNGINNRGQIVGNGQTPNDGSRALIVIKGRMERLEQYVENAEGWVLSMANAIDDRGVIVGRGSYQGAARAYRLVPVAGSQ